MPFSNFILVCIDLLTVWLEWHNWW